MDIKNIDSSSRIVIGNACTIHCMKRSPMINIIIIRYFQISKLLKTQIIISGRLVPIWGFLVEFMILAFILEFVGLFLYA